MLNTPHPPSHTYTHTLPHHHHDVNPADLSVGNDLHVHGVLTEQSVNGRETGPEVVRVEDLELGDGLELVHMSFGHLKTEWA